MAPVAFVLIALSVLTCLACTALLYRGFRRTGAPLLFWASLCFVGLSLANVLTFFDLIVYPTEIDLRVYRPLVTLAGLSFLLYGFISESD